MPPMPTEEMEEEGSLSSLLGKLSEEASGDLVPDGLPEGGGQEGEEEEEVDPVALVQRMLEGAKERGPVKADKFYCAGAKRTDEETGKKLCNYKAPSRWYGYCPKCHRPFGCLPFKASKNKKGRVTLSEHTMAAAKERKHYPTGIEALDKVLNGGVVYETTVVIGARRGSGKTTMLLQACDSFCRANKAKAYFASGEMTRDAVIAYAKRLGIANADIALYGDPNGIDVDDLFEDVLDFGAKLLIVDSLQTATVSDVKGDIGSPAMIKAITNMITSFAQSKKRAVIAIGHLQKAGDYGGGEDMQHLVDGLLRMDTIEAPDEDGNIKDIGIRQLAWDSKFREGSDDVTAYIEFAKEDGGIFRPLSSKCTRAMARLANLDV